MREKKKIKLKMKGRNENKGITLIALVITIIVLLILAAVSIATLTGENGILSKASSATDNTKDAEEDERVKLAVATALSDNLGEGLTTETLKGSLENEFGKDKVVLGTNEDENATFIGDGPWTFKGERDTYTIEKTGKITTGGSTSEDGQEADETASYVGCYADLDGNKEPDGIIYADLAVDKSDGQWNSDKDSKYSYEKKDELKKYTVSEGEVTSNKFGDKSAKMITAKSGTSGNDRFYVMALEDFDSGNAHSWYKSKSGSLPTGEGSMAVGSLVNDFGQGKTNTEYWIGKWNEDKDEGKNSNDIWKIVQDNGKLTKKYGKEWFVPSKAEWSAFGDMVWTKFDKDYTGLGLKIYYWSSSQGNSIAGRSQAWYTVFVAGYMRAYDVDGTNRVRLSATF